MFGSINLFRKSALFAVLLVTMTGQFALGNLALAADPPAPPAEQTADNGAPIEKTDAQGKSAEDIPGKSIEIIRDCNDDGVLQGIGDYTLEEIREARDQLASDVDQYSDCRAVLTAALLKNSKDPDAGGGAAIPVSPEQRARFDQLLAQERAELSAPGADPSIPIDGKTLSPGDGTTFSSSNKPGLPLPLLAVIVLCMVAAIPGLYGGAQLVMKRFGWEPNFPSFGGSGILGLGRKPRLND